MERCDQRKELLCQFRKVIDLLFEDCPAPVPAPCCPPVEEDKGPKPIPVPPPPRPADKQSEKKPSPCCTCQQEAPKEEPPCKPPTIMVCYKVNNKAKNKTNEEEKAKAKNKNLKQSKSRELRCGVLYIGCHCEKLNGLQDDCPRSECRGAPECLTRPPTCGPSEFSNGKHLYKKGCKKDGRGGTDAKDAEEELQEYECYPAVIELTAACT